MKIFISHSPSDSEVVAAVKQVVSQAEHNVASPVLADGPDEAIASLKSADIVIACMLNPCPSTLIELGIALGSGLPTIVLVGTNESLGIDLLNLPSVVSTGNAILDARAIVSAIDRIAATVPRQPIRSHSLAAIVSDPLAMDAIDGKTFEDLVYGWFADAGASIKRAPRDEGFDFRLDHEGKGFLVEVKKIASQGRVPIDAVRSLSRAINVSGSIGGMLITSSPLTSAAQSIAEQSAIRVLSPAQLLSSSSIGELLTPAANSALHLTSPPLKLRPGK